MRTTVRRLLSAACLAGLGGCLPGPLSTAEPEVAFGTGRVMIVSPSDTFHLRVDIAEDAHQHGVGLMRRTELPEDGGMIFLFDEEQAPGTGFWMHRTPLPLSIAFLDARGSIVGIREMEPCSSRFPFLCPRYPAGVPFHGALEVNRGYFLRRGVAPGDRVVLRRDSAERVGTRLPSRR